MRLADVGVLDAVTTTAFFTYLDELLADWLAPAIGSDWVTLHAEVDLLAEVRRVHRTLSGRIELERTGRSSITARAELLRDDDVRAVRALYVVAAWDPATRRSRPLTESERAMLAGSPSAAGHSA